MRGTWSVSNFNIPGIAINFYECSVIIFETESVNTVDTTGAGDAFVGAFSYALANNLNISESIELALKKATDSVTKKGTQSSYKN